MSQGRGCNLISLDRRDFHSFLSPSHAQSSIKQRAPRDGNEEVDGGGGPALPLSRSGTARDLAEALSTLGISHINLGRSLTTEFPYLQTKTMVTVTANICILC